MKTNKSFIKIIIIILIVIIVGALGYTTYYHFMEGKETEALSEREIMTKAVPSLKGLTNFQINWQLESKIKDKTLGLESKTLSMWQQSDVNHGYEELNLEAAKENISQKTYIDFAGTELKGYRQIEAGKWYQHDFALKQDVNSIEIINIINMLCDYMVKQQVEIKNETNAELNNNTYIFKATYNSSELVKLTDIALDSDLSSKTIIQVELKKPTAEEYEINKVHIETVLSRASNTVAVVNLDASFSKVNQIPVLEVPTAVKTEVDLVATYLPEISVSDYFTLKAEAGANLIYVMANNYRLVAALDLELLALGQELNQPIATLNLLNLNDENYTQLSDSIRELTNENQIPVLFHFNNQELVNFYHADNIDYDALRTAFAQ